MFVEVFPPWCRRVGKCTRVGNYPGYIGWVITHMLEGGKMFLKWATEQKNHHPLGPKGGETNSPGFRGWGNVSGMGHILVFHLIAISTDNRNLIG